MVAPCQLLLAEGIPGGETLLAVMKGSGSTVPGNKEGGSDWFALRQP